eukprot:scaffold195200_cov37-Attheya_sp.AAC.1
MPFICGKTRVYFRSGVLEFLEAKRLMAFDQMATKIQCFVRCRSALQTHDVLWNEREETRVLERERINAGIMPPLPSPTEKTSKLLGVLLRDMINSAKEDRSTPEEEIKMPFICGKDSKAPSRLVMCYGMKGKGRDESVRARA